MFRCHMFRKYLFRKFYLQKVLYLEGPRFGRYYVQKVLYSEGLTFRNICLEYPIFKGPIFRISFVYKVLSD